MPATDDIDIEITARELGTLSPRWARGSAPPSMLDVCLTADQVIAAVDAGDEPAALIRNVLRLHGLALEVLADDLRRRVHPIAGDYLTALLQFVHTEGNVGFRDDLLDELSEVGLGRIVDPRVVEMTRHERLVTAIVCSAPAIDERIARELVDDLVALPLVALVGGAVGHDVLGPAAERLAASLGIEAVRDLIRFVRLGDDARSDLDLRASARCFSRATTLVAPELLGAQLARLRGHLGERS